MGLVLDLRGTAPMGPWGPLRWLDEVQVWLSGRHPGLLRGSLPDGGAGLLLRLHPAAPGVALSLSPGEGPRGTARLRLVARTEAVGPGYHRLLCTLADALAGERGVRWDVGACGDDTGFFLGGGDEALIRAFDEELAQSARLALARLAAGETEVGLNLPPGLAIPLPGAAATPLGPRSLAWLGAVAADGAQGRDCYPWPSLEPGPSEAIGRALCLLWLEARPRPPLTDAESATWIEIADLLGGQPEGVRDAARMGYRRGPVRVSLPQGWSIEVPGAFADDVEEGGTWVAWDQTHTLWVSVLAPQDASAGATPLLGLAQEDDVELLCTEGEGWVGRATLVWVQEEEEEGVVTRYLRLAGRAAAADSVVVLTLCCTDEADRAGALRIWGSLRAARN